MEAEKYIFNIPVLFCCFYFLLQVDCSAGQHLSKDSFSSTSAPIQLPIIDDFSDNHRDCYRELKKGGADWELNFGHYSFEERPSYGHLTVLRRVNQLVAFI